ncbi:MAG: superinfection exclusion B family protein [Aphanothece saxicola GSE-SYN-MK-01-06B]|jgi:hypothetical protein|nr:superinfection exclusion B family protein [Aphanothece saxicola GSE-SYN-MK-01-06B]
MDPSKLLPFLKLSPQVLLGIFIASALLAFSPKILLVQLGLSSLVILYRGWIGGLFVLSAAMLLSKCMVTAYRKGLALYSEWRLAAGRRASFAYLSPPERALLKRYLIEDTTTLIFPISDGVVGGLVAKQYIFRPSNVGSYGMHYAFNLHPWVWVCLSKSPDLLNDPVS